MRPGIIGYFDLGVSLGLDDEVFVASHITSHPELGAVGINNPFGSGLLVDLTTEDSPVLEAWRQVALSQVSRPEMETGYMPTLGMDQNEFKDRLRELVRTHPACECRVTVYAIGTACVLLMFQDGIEQCYVQGILKCFEYAAYTPEIAESLWRLANEGSRPIIEKRRRGLISLTTRSLPVVQRDKTGYRELPLIDSFTYLFACTHKDDKGLEVDLRARWSPDPTSWAEIHYAYHGILHYSWAACILIPASYPDEDTGGWLSWLQIQRMLVGVEIAHTIQGVSCSLSLLFRQELKDRVGRYISSEVGGRSGGELNRLRAFARAAVSLMDFDAVTQCAEDREYFSLYEAAAGIEVRKGRILEYCESLFNVQDAETQEWDRRQQLALNLIVLFLAVFALISVVTDAYTYYQGSGPVLIQDKGRRAYILLEIVLCISTGVGLSAILAITHRRRLKRAISRIYRWFDPTKRRHKKRRKRVQ